jgi:hypothetical protein
MGAPPIARAVGIVHVHSDYSHDGADSLTTIRKRAARAGVSFVAWTDHAEDFDEQRFTEYSSRCGELSDTHVSLLPGLEFRFPRQRGLHLLAFGLERWVSPATPEAFVSDVTPLAELTAMAHPVLAEYRLPPAVRAGIGAIEVWNASYNTRYLPDPRAIALLQSVRRDRPEVVAIAGLDQHDGANDRRVRVVLTAPSDALTPLEALRAGRFRNRGLTMSFGPGVAWNGPQMRALIMARAVLDAIEGTQERAARAWRRRPVKD